jgi:hypothetical protein
MTDDNKSRLLGGGVPVIGAPKLSDAPLLPDEVLAKFIPVFEEALRQGASYAQPVEIELLILATALRDLRDLRAAVDGLDSVYSEDAQALLPKQPEQAQENP